MSLKRKTRTLCARLSHGCGASLWAMALAAILGSSTQGQNEDLFGKWDPPPLGYEWEVNAIHAVHLSTGKILVWPNGNNAKLWDPGDGGFTDVPNEDHKLGCAGQTALADGSILAAGGGGELAQTASKKTSIFSLAPIGPDPWEAVDEMFFPRWYPTCTTLPDGKVLAIGGSNKPLGDGGLFIMYPEVYDPVTELWDDYLNIMQPEETWKLYPRMFVLPDGTVFFAGPGVETFTLNVQTGSWLEIGDSHFGGAADSAVTYEPGKVLKCGGTAGGDRTDVIDFTQPTPAWDEVGLMKEVRRRHNLVLLPDGKILAIGGEQADPPGSGDFVPVFDAEWFDPDAPEPMWQRLAAMTRPRAGHSTAVLLPDGKVLACGGRDADFPDELTSKSGEIFSPPYLFLPGGTEPDAPRPEIGFAPTAVSYGSVFSVILTSGSPVGATEIDKVSLVRLAALTHGFDQNQRYVPLTFQPHLLQPDTLTVDAPANANLAPQGYYMLFLISDDGVPSIAKYVKLVPPATP
ncbi:MAG: galactose oxidase-like domain-containing protein [Phycisphaerales bacterium]